MTLRRLLTNHFHMDIGKERIGMIGPLSNAFLQALHRRLTSPSNSISTLIGPGGHGCTLGIEAGEQANCAKQILVMLLPLAVDIDDIMSRALFPCTGRISRAE
jgi:hypothetical protein